MLVREPFPADRFPLAPGNRIDVEFVIPDTDEPTVVFDNFNGEGFSLRTITTPNFATPTNSTVPMWGNASTVYADHTHVASLGQTADGLP